MKWLKLLSASCFKDDKRRNNHAKNNCGCTQSIGCTNSQPCVLKDMLIMKSIISNSQGPTNRDLSKAGVFYTYVIAKMHVIFDSCMTCGIHSSKVGVHLNPQRLPFTTLPCPTLPFPNWWISLHKDKRKTILWKIKWTAY